MKIQNVTKTYTEKEIKEFIDIYVPYFVEKLKLSKLSSTKFKYQYIREDFPAYIEEEEIKRCFNVFYRKLAIAVLFSKKSYFKDGKHKYYNLQGIFDKFGFIPNLDDLNMQFFYTPVVNWDREKGKVILFSDGRKVKPFYADCKSILATKIRWKVSLKKGMSNGNR